LDFDQNPVSFSSCPDTSVVKFVLPVWGVAVILDLERFAAGGRSCGLLNVPSTVLCDFLLLMSLRVLVLVVIILYWARSESSVQVCDSVCVEIVLVHVARFKSIKVWNLMCAKGLVYLSVVTLDHISFKG